MLVPPLARTMFPPALGTVLIAPVGLSMPHRPGLLAAPLAAIAPSPVAVLANPESALTIRVTTLVLLQKDRSAVGHGFAVALDNGLPDMSG